MKTLLTILVIIVLAFVCLVLIFGGIALIMRTAENRYAKKMAKMNRLNIINLKNIHYGNFLALTKIPNGHKIIAYSKKYKDVVEEAKTKNVNYSIFSMPKRGALQTHVAN